MTVIGSTHRVVLRRCRAAPVDPTPIGDHARLHGTGNSRIGPRVADRLMIPVLDREVLAVTQRLDVSDASVESYDPKSEETPRR